MACAEASGRARRSRKGEQGPQGQPRGEHAREVCVAMWGRKGTDLGVLTLLHVVPGFRTALLVDGHVRLAGERRTGQHWAASGCEVASGKGRSRCGGGDAQGGVCTLTDERR